jgi:HEAT repeat protein
MRPLLRAVSVVSTLLLGGGAVSLLVAPDARRDLAESRHRPTGRAPLPSPRLGAARAARTPAPGGRASLAAAAAVDSRVAVDGGSHRTAHGRAQPRTRSDYLALAARKGPIDASELARLRERLLGKDAKARAEALRELRDRGHGELDPEVRGLLADRSCDFASRRLAAQVLALGDAATNKEGLEPFKNDPDPVVRINVAYGLARGGDEAAQAWLLRLLTASKAVSPTLAPYVESVLRSPELTSPDVIDHYQRIASDPRRDAATRERASAILAAKTGPR